MLVCGPPVQQQQCPVTAIVEPLWGGRWELRGRRVEKRWRTTEKGQQRKDRNKEICRIMKQIRTPKIKKRIRG